MSGVVTGAMPLCGLGFPTKCGPRWPDEICSANMGRSEYNRRLRIKFFLLFALVIVIVPLCLCVYLCFVLHDLALPGNISTKEHCFVQCPNQRDAICYNFLVASICQPWARFFFTGSRARWCNLSSVALCLVRKNVTKFRC